MYKNRNIKITVVPLTSHHISIKKWHRSSSMTNGILWLCLNLSLTAAGPFSCWQAANDYEEMADLTCLGCFTSPLLVEDGGNKLADEERDHSHWLKCYICLHNVSTLVSLKLLSGTFCSSVCRVTAAEVRHVVNPSDGTSANPSPSFPTWITGVSDCRVQTRRRALVPVIISACHRKWASCYAGTAAGEKMVRRKN